MWFSTFSKEPNFAPISQKDESVETVQRVDHLLDESTYFDATEDFVDKSVSLHCQEEQYRAEWKKTCDAILKNPENCPHRERLVVFSSGMEERRAAQASIEQIFQEVHATLNCILEESLACAVPVHENICSKMTDLETDLLSLFQRNHERRRGLLQSLEDFNDTWRMKYNDFTSRVTLESNRCIEGDTEAVSGANAPGELLRSSAQESNTPISISKNDGQDGLLTEPDWEDMVEFNPSSCSNIESFLTGSSTWNAACEEFLGCFDDIRQTIEISHSNMLKILEAAYVRLSDGLDGVQMDIQEHIVSNTHRREQIEQALQQVVQQQQSIFSRLMARVGGKAVNSDKEPAAETSKGTCLRAMIPFANIFSQSN
jgi:hypothetical protein